MDGLFSSLEKAEAAKLELEKIRDNCRIEEFKVDALSGKKALPHWRATVNMKTGELLLDKEDGSYKWYEGMFYEWEHEGEHFAFDTYEWAIQGIPYRYQGYVPQQLTLYSRKSQEAARELALAAWKELDRRIDLSKVYEQHKSLFYPVDETEKLYADGVCKSPF